MGWNPVKAVKKAVKKVTGGLKKAFKGVKNIGSKIIGGLRSAGREVKRFAKTDLGKLVIGAALIYVGGAAYLAMNSAGTVSFASALASPGAVVGQLGIGAGATEAAATSATAGGAGATSAAAFPTVAGAEAAGVGAGVTSGAATSSGAVNLGASLGTAATEGAVASGTTTAATGGMLSEGMKMGAMMVGGNAISGAMQAKGAAEAEEEAEKARQRYINGNKVPAVNFDNLAGLSYNPMTGKSEGAGQGAESYLPEHLRVNSNLSNKYSTQGLLTQGAS